MSTAFSLVVVVTSFIPATARLYEATMMHHMLVQMPLLGMAGWVVLRDGATMQAFLQRYDPYGALALVSATGWVLFWMIPLHLDLTTIDPMFRLLKVVSVPLGIGFCFCWVWLCATPLLKAIVVFEGWAMLARLGWIYLESPERLCSSYLLGEQRAVGIALLIVAGVSAIALLGWCMFARFAEVPEHGSRIANDVTTD